MTRQEIEARRLECDARSAEVWARSYHEDREDNERQRLLGYAADKWEEAAKAWAQVPAEVEG